MTVPVTITIGKTSLRGELFDTACARSIAEILPIEKDINRWGDEFYFEIPISVGLDEGATTAVKVGDIGYWPPGAALAIFFGPTPLSTGEDPVPAGAVNMVGKILGRAEELRKEKGAAHIRIEKA
ncbi:MAG TPA: cyclophilin-like fold protein [Syntrophorhabdaceae bacterium]